MRSYIGAEKMLLPNIDTSKAIEVIYSKFRDNKNIKILDLGCGFAHYHPELNGLGYKYITGVDIDPDFVEVAKELNPYYTYQVKDICKELSFEENSFDVVLGIEILEHVHSPKPLIENMLKMVKPNGICYISTPNALGFEFQTITHGFKKINASVAQYLSPGVTAGLIKRLGGRILWCDNRCRYLLGHIYMTFSKD